MPSSVFEGVSVLNSKWLSKSEAPFLTAYRRNCAFQKTIGWNWLHSTLPKDLVTKIHFQTGSRDTSFKNKNTKKTKTKTCFCLPSDAAAAKSLQSCPTLCDPIEGSPPGSPVAAILQARTLEWAAISFSDA